MSFTRILVAVDGSPRAARALEAAVELARCLRAELGVVHVVDPGRAADAEGGLLAAEILEDRRREGAEILGGARRQITDAASSAEDFLAQGHPAEEILTTTRKWKADLVVIASHGRSGLARVVMGSIAEQVVRHAPVPVLVVRGEGS